LEVLTRCTIGGAYDTVPEVCILLGLFEHSDKFLPIVFDEAGEDILLFLIAELISPPLKVTELPLNIFSLLSMEQSPLSICSITVKPTPSFLVTLNWV
jgi:hypothetical protein